MEPQIIYGPIAPGGNGIIYQVTLASGAVVTNPAAFGDAQDAPPRPWPLIADDGTVLTPAARTDSPRRA
jgi:hypothetical protein